MNRNEFIEINRGIRELSVYHDANIMPVFLHLLLTANATDSEWQGETVHAGETVTSPQCIAAELGMKTDMARYALTVLEARGLIKVRLISEWRIVSLTEAEKWRRFPEA